jgi:hypothetical protein
MLSTAPPDKSATWQIRICFGPWKTVFPARILSERVAVHFFGQFSRLSIAPVSASFSLLDQVVADNFE